EPSQVPRVPEPVDRAIPRQQPVALPALAPGAAHHVAAQLDAGGPRDGSQEWSPVVSEHAAVVLHHDVAALWAGDDRCHLCLLVRSDPSVVQYGRSAVERRPAEPDDPCPGPDPLVDAAPVVLRPRGPGGGVSLDGTDA